MQVVPFLAALAVDNVVSVAKPTKDGTFSCQKIFLT